MKLITTFAIFLILLSVGVSAFTLSNPKYVISGVISGGGGAEAESEITDPLITTDDRYTAFVSIAQPFTTGSDITMGGIGGKEYYGYSPTTQSGILLAYEDISKKDVIVYKMCLGVFCTDVFETPYSISVSGNINYDIGDPVANSKAKLIARYGKAKYEKEETTGPNGEFSASVVIPEFIATNENGFCIQIYAKGKVEAIYECLYQNGICAKDAKCEEY